MTFASRRAAIVLTLLTGQDILTPIVVGAACEFVGAHSPLAQAQTPRPLTFG